MKKITLVFTFLFLLGKAFSQDVKRSLQIDIEKDKQLIIVTGDASVDYTGYSGDQVLVSEVKEISASPAAAKGMIRISGKRPAEQADLSYTKSKTDNHQVKIKINGHSKHLLIRVPCDIIMLSVQAYSLNPNSLVTIEHFNGQLDVHAVAKSILLRDVGGPFRVQADAGDISLKEIHWSTAANWKLNPLPPNFDHPYIIQSRTADIRIYTDAHLKANVDLRAPRGKIRSDFKIGRNGQLNGGGASILAMAELGDIYLYRSK